MADNWNSKKAKATEIHTKHMVLSLLKISINKETILKAAREK